MAWQRHKGGWGGDGAPVPSVARFVDFGPIDRDELRAPFAEALRRHHPELFTPYRGHAMTPGYNMADRAVSEALQTLWRRHGSFDVPAAAVEQLLDEFAVLVDRDASVMDFVAPLVNVLDLDGLALVALPGGLTLRPTTDEEATRIFGGPVQFIRTCPYENGHPVDCVLAGAIEVPRRWPPEPWPALEDVRGNIERVVTALRVLRGSPVGVIAMHLTPRTFYPIPYPYSRSVGDEHVPRGGYQLSATDVPEIARIAEALHRGPPRALAMACRRLSSAAVRLDPADRLVDAVIGMEAILLAGMSQKTELRYRFALHYARVCADGMAREGAFRFARDIYDLRSKVVHGEAFDGPIKVGDANLAPDAAADAAREALRSLVKRFLHAAPAGRPFTEPQFWHDLVLGHP